MADHTNKDIEFLSNRELVGILRSLLDELDVVANTGAHRATTYLAVSAIEGIFGEILRLLDIGPGAVPGKWPKRKDGGLKKPAELTLAEREWVLKAAGALPSSFEELYGPVRGFRNYMHPERELKDRTPIAQSVAQLALACLNGLIEEYAPRRFAAGQEWQLMYGIAQVPAADVVRMPQNPGEAVSFLVSKLPAERFEEVAFRVSMPPDTVFNFVYNYFSLDQFRAARIEGRAGQNGRGFDNGQVLCTKWRAWGMNGRYTADSEPSPRELQHAMRVTFDPPGAFVPIVDGVPLELQGGIDWEYDPQGKIGFMTELGPVSVIDLVVRAR